MPNTPVLHPVTGTFCFGHVPEMRSRGTVLPAGEIRLLKGRHFGPNKGFGVAHIWAEHANDMEKLGLRSESEVAHYVTKIIATGAPLFYSGESFRQTKLTVLRITVGTAILEHRHLTGISVWSVVTAFDGKRRHGTRVGSVL